MARPMGGRDGRPHAVEGRTPDGRRRDRRADRPSKIRIGDHWLTDWASCNYLGFDLDEEIIAAVPEYLAKWGTHPSWSRLLGSPRLYEEIEEQMTDLLGVRGRPAPPDDHPHPHVDDPGARGRRHRVPGRPGAQDDLRRRHGRRRSRRARSSGSGTTTPRISRSCWPPPTRDNRALIAMDGVNSMTGNAPDIAAFARLANEHDALLYVDDAHGFGVIGERSPDELCDYGTTGNSLFRHQDVPYDNVILVAGFSKSYSSLLAFIALPTRLKDALKVLAPPYLYSGPSPVASLATTIAGLEVNRTRGDDARFAIWRRDPPRARRAGAARHRDAERERIPHHRGAARRPRRRSTRSAGTCSTQGST